MVYGGCYGGGCYGGGCYGGGCYGGGWGGCYGGYSGRRMAGGWGYGGYAWGYSPRMGGYAYSPGGYNYASPMMADNQRYGDSSTDRSFYYSPGSERRNEATIVVHLPADAKLTVDGKATQSTSDTRVFTSPPLEPGKTYHYTLRGEVNRNGKTLNAKKEVEVRAGRMSEVTLDFPGLNRGDERLKSPAPEDFENNPDSAPRKGNRSQTPPVGESRAPRELKPSKPQ
jgi:uncharacterized protein (TIGR03000 family)